MQKTLLSSGLIVMMVVVLFPFRSVVTAGDFDEPSVAIDELAIDESASDTVTDNDRESANVVKKKKGNGFVRALGAPFRAFGRLFGGGSKKNDQQVRRISNKEMEKFEANKVVRIKDATTPVVTPAADSTSPTAASDTAFANYLKEARAFLTAGNANAAIVQLTTATAINQRSAEANNLLGVAYEAKGWRDSALKSFEKAVNFDEDNAEYLNNLGYLLYKSGEYERATKYLKRAAKIARNNTRIWNNLGLAYCEREKFDDAYKSFAQAAGEYGGRLSTAAQLQQRGYAKDAIKHLEKAQAMRPNSADVLTKLVSLYEMTGRPTDAENARRTIVALKTSADANK